MLGGFHLLAPFLIVVFGRIRWICTCSLIPFRFVYPLQGSKDKSISSFSCNLQVFNLFVWTFSLESTSWVVCVLLQGVLEGFYCIVAVTSPGSWCFLLSRISVLRDRKSHQKGRWKANMWLLVSWLQIHSEANPSCRMITTQCIIQWMNFAGAKISSHHSSPIFL